MKPNAAWQDESPVLRRIATVRRVDAFFQAMSHDFLLRQQFITNPIHVLSEYVYGTQIPSERASVSNQLIYAALSDREFLSWVHFYASEHRDNVPSGAEFVKDFAQAIVDHGGHHAVIALIRSAVAGNGLVGFDDDLLHFFSTSVPWSVETIWRAEAKPRTLLILRRKEPKQQMVPVRQ
jgi:hypothetical protein